MKCGQPTTYKNYYDNLSKPAQIREKAKNNLSFNSDMNSDDLIACPKEFSTKNGKAEHIKKIHEGNTQTEFKCELGCENLTKVQRKNHIEGFASNWILLRHYLDVAEKKNLINDRGVYTTDNMKTLRDLILYRHPHPIPPPIRQEDELSTDSFDFDLDPDYINNLLSSPTLLSSPNSSSPNVIMKTIQAADIEEREFKEEERKFKEEEREFKEEERKFKEKEIEFKEKERKFKEKEIDDDISYDSDISYGSLFDVFENLDNFDGKLSNKIKIKKRSNKLKKRSNRLKKRSNKLKKRSTKKRSNKLKKRSTKKRYLNK